jgi:hypothetical protein
MLCKGAKKIAQNFNALFKLTPPHMTVTAAHPVATQYSLVHSNGVCGPGAVRDLRNDAQTFILHKYTNRNQPSYIIYKWKQCSETKDFNHPFFTALNHIIFFN